MSLEFLAMHWMRFEKRCPVALFERTPRPGAGQPDVIGVTAAGYLLEIEIKRSLADFRANAKKPHIHWRNLLHNDGPGHMTQVEYERALGRFPRQFWFMVPETLAPKVEPELPKWAGLIHPVGYQLHVKVPAPTNPHATRLTPREMIKLGNNMANQIYSQARVINTFNENQNNPEWIPDMACII